jgi:DNA-binding Xre family transcriptional regulator
MANQLTYSEIMDICAEKKITVTKLAENVQMTLHGLKAALQKQTVSSQVVFAICKELDITPNRFFRWEDCVSNYNTTQVGVMNSQNIGSNGIELLQQQLTVKDEQIKHLLNLLNKLNK